MSLKKLSASAALVLVLLYGIGAAVWALAGARELSLDRVSASDLNRQWGCGRSFAASNNAQTAAIVVSFDSSSEPREGVIGGSDWSGEVFVGRRLFDGWCDDTSNRAEVSDQATVVAGTVVMRDHESSSDTAYRARLVGVAIELPDGTVHQLGDLEVQNSEWGSDRPR